MAPPPLMHGPGYTHLICYFVRLSLIQKPLQGIKRPESYFFRNCIAAVAELLLNNCLCLEPLVMPPSPYFMRLLLPYGYLLNNKSIQLPNYI